MRCGAPFDQTMIVGLPLSSRSEVQLLSARTRQLVLRFHIGEPARVRGLRPLFFLKQTNLARPFFAFFEHHAHRAARTPNRLAVFGGYWQRHLKTTQS
jgi:hypothetical protein